MNAKLIKRNLKEALEIINSPEYDEGDFAYLEGLLDEALKEAGADQNEATSYTILSGESYSVEATSEDEALAKFFVAYGFASADDYKDEGYDLANAEDEVSEVETRTEVIN